ncbi:MAG: S1 RNA-binding domain-containing protein [Patescibacteria group bacterium]|nr:S1 RNA-binding domain-containing protein [Patescibacteria group bacterium]
MKNLLKKIKKFEVGQMVTGRVLKIGKNEVWLDLGGLATGVVRGAELQDELGDYLNLKVGDEATALVIDEENERGEVELSFRAGAKLKTSEMIKKIQEEGRTISVKVIDANRGGLIVQYKKISGFIPSSQLSSQHFPQVVDGDKNKILEKLKEIVGQSLEVKIISSDETNKKVIFSEKEVELEKKSSLFKKYKVGDIVEGRVVGISPFGVFVELDDQIKGLVHISEIAWQKIEKIEEVVKVGDRVKAVVLSVDDSKISLSLKRTQENPWKMIEKKYKVGDLVQGKISKIRPYGFLVEVEKDIYGLAHISEIPEEIMKEKIKVGQIFSFKIISLESEDHRLGLSLKEVTQK